MKRLAIILTLCSFAHATTYYVSKTLGSDSNTTTQAQSKSTPWQHLPGMAGCTTGCTSLLPANHTPVAGDSYILYGGDSWNGTDLGINWTWSGTSTSASPGCTGTGCIYIGVDQTWHSGGSWTRPIFNGGGSAVATPSGGVANVFFRLYANYVIFDNIEMTGLFWTGSPNGTSSYILFAAGTPGEGTNDTVEHNYIHGWSHGTAGGGTTEHQCGIVGDTGIPNNNANSIALQNVIDGTDTDQQSCTAYFGGPPYLEQNFVQYATSGAIVNGPVLIDSNTFINITHSFDSNAHENGLEINASQNVTVSNNVIAHLGTGALGMWVAPYPTYTATVFNNILFDTDTGNVFDIAPAVYTAGNCTQATTYCTVSGTTNAYNNTIECGPNSNPAAVCFAGIDATATAATIENNHVITNATSPNGGLWSTNGITPTVTTNTIQTLSTANTQGYNESTAFPWTPPSGGSTIGAGTNLNVSLCGTFVTLCADTAVGVSYNATSHTVSYPNRTQLSRPLSAAWDTGAYEFSATTSATMTGTKVIGAKIQ